MESVGLECTLKIYGLAHLSNSTVTPRLFRLMAIRYGAEMILQLVNLLDSEIFICSVSRFTSVKMCSALVSDRRRMLIKVAELVP